MEPKAELETVEPNESPASTAPTPRTQPRAVLLGIGLAVLAVTSLGGWLFVRAERGINGVALAGTPKGVTVVEASATTYRPSRRYVGTIEPWVSARIGPQLVSAYVDTVLVRPGAVVKRGQVLATLDCRNSSAMEQAIAMQARALEARHAAIAKEASRLSSLLEGGFASENEVEKKRADDASQQANLLALQAQLTQTSLRVSDCILRAPFDGEVAERMMDPGSFARPGSAVATLVDRSVTRVTADVPESDFSAVSPGTPVDIRLHAIAQGGTGKITRRSPSADPSTRTIRIEIDLPNPDRTIPVGTTADLWIELGEPQPASSLPLAAAAVKGKRATVFLVQDGKARARTALVKGESGGTLYLDPTSLPPGSLVVTEGRTALFEGDAVDSKRADTKVSSRATGPTHLAAETPQLSPSRQVLR